MIPWNPFVCNYYVTLRCNDTCEFCEIWQREEFKTLEEAPLENIIRNLEDLKKMGVRYVDVTGGEPLLRADTPLILKASKERGFFTVLTTNGILFKDRAFEVSPFVDMLLFSLDSPIEEEHDRIRGVSCYSQVIEGLKIAKKLVNNVAINFTVTRDSVLYLPEMVDLSEKLGVFLWINPVFRYGGAEGFQKESVDYIARYRKKKNVAFNLAGLDLILQGGNNVGRPACRAASSVVTILPDDRLVLPCFYKQDFSAKIDGKLRDLYRSSRASYRKRQGRFEECRGCLAWPYMNPSFLHGFDKKFFLGLYSLGSLLWKESKF
ncbi:radical SAM protein [Candidatus Margulisiibacteriota bacterium]